MRHIPLGADAKSVAADIDKKGVDYKGLMNDDFNNAYAALEPGKPRRLLGALHRRLDPGGGHAGHGRQFCRLLVV